MKKIQLEDKSEFAAHALGSLLVRKSESSDILPEKYPTEKDLDLNSSKIVNLADACLKESILKMIGCHKKKTSNDSLEVNYQRPSVPEKIKSSQDLTTDKTYSKLNEKLKILNRKEKEKYNELMLMKFYVSQLKEDLNSQQTLLEKMKLGHHKSTVLINTKIQTLQQINESVAQELESAS